MSIEQTAYRTLAAHGRFPGLFEGGQHLKKASIKTCPTAVCMQTGQVSMESAGRYPLFMSTRVRWPEGAGDNEIMLQEHDCQLLEAEPGEGYEFQWFNNSAT
jgi:hypothetical protein